MYFHMYPRHLVDMYRVLLCVRGSGACTNALTIKHAVTPKFWHGFHPKQT